MSAMVLELKAVGNNLTDEQQIQAVIHSLPDSWEQMKPNMTHNESIQKHPNEVRMEENPKREPIPPSAQGASVVDGNKLNKCVLTVE